MKKIIVLLGLIFLNSSLLAKTWQEILDEKKALLKGDSYLVIKKQYESFVSQKAPVIAAPAITDICIIENNEILVDIHAMRHQRIAMLPNAPDDKKFAGPMYNSGFSSSSKVRMGIWLKLENMLVHLDALAEDFGYKPGSISIKIFEGLRDLKTQAQLFQEKVNEIKLQDEKISDEDAEKEASKWVSPVKNNIPAHSTGAAIDIRLWNDDAKDFVDLGQFGVIWGTKKEGQTFLEDISDVQKLNRLYLLMAAAKAGLINYVYEYWHYSAGDRYAAYWQENDTVKRSASYGSVKKEKEYEK